MSREAKTPGPVVDFDHDSIRFRLLQHEMDVQGMRGALSYIEDKLLLPPSPDDAFLYRVARLGLLVGDMAGRLDDLRREKAEALSGLEAGERELVELRALDELFGNVIVAATSAGLLCEDDYPEKAERDLVEYFQGLGDDGIEAAQKLQDTLESLDGKLPQTPAARTRRMIALMRKGKKAEARK